MNPILTYIAFVSFWGGVVSMMLNYKEPKSG